MSKKYPPIQDDQPMLDKMWETFLYIRGDATESQAHFDYAIRCELGQPEIYVESLKGSDGKTFGTQEYTYYRMPNFGTVKASPRGLLKRWGVIR